MSMTIPSAREQGIEALREGNLDEAIDLLARAVMLDGQDAGAQMFLGVAYSQKGLHAEALRALRTAVELRPQEARCYFNLGVALESAGDVSGAVAAYRQAVQINPEQAQARARLQGLNAGLAAPPAAASTAASGAPGWAQPGPAAGLSPVTTPAAGPAGTVECARCHQWSKPGLSCEWCSAPLQRAQAAAQPAAPWLQPAYTDKMSGGSAGSAISLAPDMDTGEAFGRRFAASFIDGIIVEVIAIVAGLMLGIGLAGAGAAGAAPGQGAAGGLGFLLGAGIGTVYYCGMLSLWGKTLGKMALGLRVVGPDGGNPSLWRAFLREIIGKPISSIVLCLGYLWMLWDGEQQTWHDKIAGTHVERA